MSTKQCVHCDITISGKATTCPQCQKLQSKTAQRFLFTASIASVISAAGAIALLAAQYSSDVYARLVRGDDVIPVAFRTNGKALFYNNGYRPLLLTTVEVDVEDLNYHQSIELHLLVPNGKTAAIDLQEKIVEPGYAGFASKSDLDIALDKEDPRLFPGVTVQSDPGYLFALRHSKRLKTFDCNGLINAISVDGKETSSINFNCLGIIYRNKDKYTGEQYLTDNLTELKNDN